MRDSLAAGARRGLFVDDSIAGRLVLVEVLDELGDGGDFVLARVVC
jgi:hypothetical protein